MSKSTFDAALTPIPVKVKLPDSEALPRISSVVVGLAWAGFCMALLEGVQLYAKRNALEMLEQEHPAPKAIASPQDQSNDKK